MKRRVRALGLALALAGQGCTTGSVIHRSHGPDVVGSLAGSDGEWLYVEKEGGMAYAVDRRTVVGLDLPGTAALWTGGAALFFGGVMFASASGENDRFHRREDYNAAAFYTAVALPLLAYGSYLFYRQYHALHSTNGRTFVLASPPDLPSSLAVPGAPFDATKPATHADLPSGMASPPPASPPPPVTPNASPSFTLKPAAVVVPSSPPSTVVIPSPPAPVPHLAEPPAPAPHLAEPPAAPDAGTASPDASSLGE